MARGAVGTTTDAPLASIGILSALPYRYRREAIRDTFFTYSEVRSSLVLCRTCLQSSAYCPACAGPQ